MTQQDVGQEFTKLQNRVAQELNSFLGHIQDGDMELQAQHRVDDLFRRLKARRKLLEMTKAGIVITGCTLGFNIGQIGVKFWKTEFLTDPFGTSQMEPSAVALGYANGYQLYISRGKDSYPRLVVRQGKGRAFTVWTPMLDGLPATDSLHYVVLERAKTLGYIDLLRTHND